MSQFEDKILQAYRNGSDLGYIVESFNVTHKQIKKILISYKEQNHVKRTFTEEFKKLIAERDMNGVARRQIANELDINVNTVKKACEQFGQSFKERASSENEFTKIEGEFSKDSCPSCSSKNVNEVEEDTIYCMDCGNEFIIKEDHILKVNWEYIE